MVATNRTAQHRVSRRTCRPIVLLGALPLLMLTGCQTSKGSSSCMNAPAGSQTALDCQKAAELTFIRRVSN